MSKIVMTFKKGQQTTIKVEGVPGGDCTRATEPYLKGMPGRTVSDTPTPEMHLPPVTQQVEQTLGQ